MTEDDILWLYAPEERADWRRVDVLINKRADEALTEIRRMAEDARQAFAPRPPPEQIAEQAKINRLVQEMAMYQAVSPWQYEQCLYSNAFQPGTCDWTAGLIDALIGPQYPQHNR